MTDERISRISASGTTARSMRAVSTTSALSSQCVQQPKCRKMATDASTSRSFGQFSITQVSAHKSVAAKIGSTLFLSLVS